MFAEFLQCLPQAISETEGRAILSKVGPQSVQDMENKCKALKGNLDILHAEQEKKNNTLGIPRQDQRRASEALNVNPSMPGMGTVRSKPLPWQEL